MRVVFGLAFNQEALNMKPLNEKQLRQLVQTPWDDLKKAFPNYPRRFLEQEKKRAQAALPAETLIGIDYERLQKASQLREAERLYKAAVQENQQLKSDLAQALSLPEITPKDVHISGKGVEREATAIVLASDWHCEEQVLPEQVNGINEYNLKVFDNRSRWFFHNVAKMLKKESDAIPIRNCVLWIGGDMISGNIHDDLSESNLLAPMDAIALVQDTLAGGLHQLLKETNGKIKFTVVISCGNHSRITKKPRVQTEHGLSLEWFMGHNLAREFRESPQVEVIRTRAYHTYVEVHGRVIRFHHGHQVPYGGGIGGITIPFNKKIGEWNKMKTAYLDCIGHFHQLFYGPNFVVNGSMVGHNPFAIAIGAAYQPPQQAFFLIDSKHGLTVRAPILLEEV